ncbi:SDR family NAD(P)-dependent oxidoreductase [Parvularcula maris]|uniref:SDR family NAD(P)-dependent oxidoreductase n=1 Tax=Parvularcula maris TaxID=2965077 RepID=A0A9X2LAX6_9PROT|nr:SDR family NAD(P)-dependent oxidoreductase [Parvularcula maris]MCQ8185227.1 SDR family NAD(P)-dependent oxidoreductase [Parvularcula maris]
MSSRGAAVITGAGSGIGRALAQLCASRGYDLVLYDINGEELETCAEEARRQGGRVSSRVLDVRDESAIAQAAEEVSQEHGSVALLFNNAGVALGGRFEDTTPEDYRWLMEINLFGVVNMTRSFLPLLRKHQPSARIVNISSIFGIIAPAGQTAYSAAKFGVRGFSEALRHELEDTSVGVTVVHPGGVATNIAKRAKLSPGITEAEHKEALKRAEKSLVMPPPRAAEIILDGAEAGKKRVLVGNDARFAALVQQLLPVGYWDVLKRNAGLRLPKREES